MPYTQTKTEEFWNSLTHAFGLCLASVGVPFLFANTDLTNANTKLGLGIYAFSLLLLFSASTAYHYVTAPQLKRKLRVLDHISIYVLIAGTYSPIVLTLLKDSNGELLFYSVWIIAIIGTILKLFFTGKFENISLLLYLIMGWLIVFDSVAVIETFQTLELIMLCLGGFFYIIGIYFYIKPSIPFHHVIWHIFVILGSLCHFLMIYFSMTRL